jgi:hypothetical protein
MFVMQHKKIPKIMHFFPFFFMMYEKQIHVKFFLLKLIFGHFFFNFFVWFNYQVFLKKINAKWWKNT